MIAGVVVRIALLAIAFGMGTSTFGWVAVPLIAAAWGGVVRERQSPAPVAAASAALAVVALLVWTAWAGPLAELARQLGAVTGLPGFLWIGATILFPAALAWSAALLASAAVTLTLTLTLTPDPSPLRGTLTPDPSPLRGTLTPDPSPLRERGDPGTTEQGSA